MDNKLQTNGHQSWKWVTITGRVFVDNSDLEISRKALHDVGEDPTADEIFEELARDRIIAEVIPHSDEPFKFDAITFEAEEPGYRRSPSMPF